MTLHLKFWGTRGSIPRPQSSVQVRDRIRAILNVAEPEDIRTPADVDAFINGGCRGALPTVYGGNTSCVQLSEEGGPSLLIDLGSGARDYASHVMRTTGPVAPEPFHVLMSHFHWDHIMGFPFFMPAYIPGNTIHFYGCHAWLEEAIRRQHGAPSFPVEWSRLGADVRFTVLEPGRPHDLAGFRVTARRQHHTGDSYGYRFERDGRVVVYSTDSEHKLDDPAETAAFAEFFRDADLVIFDAQYSLAEAISIKEDWGHSSNVVGVELCQMARAKHLCMFHHEPTYDDEQIAAMLAETRRLEAITRGDHAVQVSAAWDGMELVL
jgi:phosphoribosyl 1,2-cyclic phosphodiesterase